MDKILNNLKFITSQKPKILVVGDLMLDQYLIGDVDRISPEAPVPILSLVSKKNVLGGAGNVISNLINFGAEVTVATVTGDDENGMILRDKIKTLGISTKNIFSSKKINTTIKTRFVSSGTQLLRMDIDSKGIDQNLFVKLKKTIIKLIYSSDAVIISDYDKGVCESKLVKDIICSANINKIPVLIDPKGKNWDKYSSSFCITPNKLEVEKILNVHLIDEKDLIRAAEKLIQKYNLKSCIITLGSKGMLFYRKSNHFFQAPIKKEVFDVSGAGDTVIACLAVCFSVGMTDKEAISMANATASQVVGYHGTTPFDMSMILRDRT
jgi:D-beta-D-heptose 7-phosphate kinase / D-beta-D-heptose 1-phosphate adenosyltransferase